MRRALSRRVAGGPAEHWPEPAAGRTVRQWHERVRLDVPHLFRAAAKALLHGGLGNWPGAAAELPGLLKLRRRDAPLPERAWALLHNALLRAVVATVVTHRATRALDEEEVLAFCDQLDATLAEEVVVLTPALLRAPAAQPLVARARELLEDWMEVLGAPGQAAEAGRALVAHLPYALEAEWRAAPDAYAPLEAFVDGPFARERARLAAWRDLARDAARQVDAPLFGQPVTLRQVYVPPYAHRDAPYVMSAPRDPHARPGRDASGKPPFLVDLLPSCVRWATDPSPVEPLRVVAGGPGAGKSAFARMLAACLGEQPAGRVLLVPLHEAPLKDDLGDLLDQYLPDLPEALAPLLDEDRVVVILDGLDEYALGDARPEEFAERFVKSIERYLARVNRQQARVLVALTCRELFLDAFRLPAAARDATYRLAPYLTRRDLFQYDVKGEDQRDLWWRRYEAALGVKVARGFPHHLRQSELEELTRQPLLNHLVALAHAEGELAEGEARSRNALYRALVRLTYRRTWEPRGYPTSDRIRQEDFFLLLGEAGLATLETNGRIARVSRVTERARARGIDGVEGEHLRTGVTGLLLAFYVRGHGLGSNASVEFTHRTFGEYLAALALVEAAKATARMPPGEAAAWWLRYAARVRVTPEVLDWLRDEWREQTDAAPEGQRHLADLLSWTLAHGWPLRDAPDEPPAAAGNVERALLCTLCGAAWTTRARSAIRWPSPDAPGALLSRTHPQRLGPEGDASLQALAWLDLRHARLDGRDLLRADLRHADLRHAALDLALLREADLRHALLEKASLFGANLSFAKLDAAVLREANLHRATLDHADLGNAQFVKANVTDASFRSARHALAHLSETVGYADFTTLRLGTDGTDASEWPPTGYEANVERGTRRKRRPEPEESL